MHTNEPRKNPLTDLGYETEDLNMNGLFKGTMWFFGFAFFSMFAGGLLFWWMNNRGISESHETSPQPFTKRTPPDPNPLLQTNVTARTDTQALRKAERNALTTPAYVNQGKGVVRIPIDHAIDLTVDRLQGRAAAALAPAPRATTPLTQPGTETTPEAGQPGPGQPPGGPHT